MIHITDKHNCSGCTACFSICGQHAITMQPDQLGFKYPVVDAEKCVECGLCKKVCAFNDDYATPENLKQPLAYAARHKSIGEVEKSRSGAMFAAISDYILGLGGVIYGVGYDSSFRVMHKRATSKAGRDEFRGSKYVQSDMGTVMNQVAEDLRQGNQVLFSGTPCQTAGLSSFLRLRRVDTTNLLVCDIVCHGVPGPKLWEDYLKYIERKERAKVTKVNFRDKSKFGWTAHKESFEIDDTYTYTYTYTYTFYQHIMFRPSCGNCHYTNLRRTGDITLADFWGWENTDTNINRDDKGVSLIFINTPKGERVLSEIKGNVQLIKAKLENCMQPNLMRPSTLHPQSEQFAIDYERLGFERTMKKYSMMGWKYDLNNFKARIRGIAGRTARKLKVIK